jgi:hypothetical protein
MSHTARSANKTAAADRKTLAPIAASPLDLGVVGSVE